MYERFPESVLTTDGVIFDSIRTCSAVISLPRLFNIVITAFIEVSSNSFRDQLTVKPALNVPCKKKAFFLPMRNRSRFKLYKILLKPGSPFFV